MAKFAYLAVVTGAVACDRDALPGPYPGELRFLANDTADP
jgi:hypothetical protein